MTWEEVTLSHMIDERTAQYGYGVYKLEQELGGGANRVELSSTYARRNKILIIFRAAVQQSVEAGVLAAAVSKNIDRELAAGNCGRL